MYCVSILTRPEGRVQHYPLGEVVRVIGFQSSPVPKDGCNPRHRVVEPIAQVVSILTRPEGRVQLLSGGELSLTGIVSILTRPEGRVQRTRNLWVVANQAVSILTRPEGRVQPCAAWGLRRECPLPFQSSPVPKDGCNPHGIIPDGETAGVSILTRPEGRVQRTRTGAPCPVALFQSSPVPKDGCNQVQHLNGF